MIPFANVQAEIISRRYDAVVIRIVETPVGGAQVSEGVEAFIDYAVEPPVVGYFPWCYFRLSPVRQQCNPKTCLRACFAHLLLKRPKADRFRWFDPRKINWLRPSYCSLYREMLRWDPRAAANTDIGVFALEHIGDDDFGGGAKRVFTFKLAMIAVVERYGDEPWRPFPKKGAQLKERGLPAVGRT